ncbi:MAG: aminoglycoside phosphotransferase family protein [Nocardioidaceae bacterium]
MHADQVELGDGAVARLVADQFPQWRDLPVRAVASPGTVNALFRLGDDVVLRFPLRPSPGRERREELMTEQDNARRIVAQSPVAVPEPLGLGEPGDGYAGHWAAYRWIPGGIVNDDNVRDRTAFARDLAAFVRAVHSMDTAGRTWDGHTRGGPLHASDADVRASLARSTHLVDTVRLAALWDVCLDAPGGAADVWIHADLMPGNLLVRDGALAAVIDLETVCIGDPAVDLMPAWNLMGADDRARFHEALGIDDATWVRGRGWAMVQAIVALPYYVDTNPHMADTARRTLDALLA